MTSAPPHWSQLAAAVPLAATAWMGLGPFRRNAGSAPKLTGLVPSKTSLLAAVETAGLTGNGLLHLLVWSGGSIAAADLARETQGADPDDLRESVERLVTAGLVDEQPDGGLRLTPGAHEVLGPAGTSLADQNAITSEELAQVCKVLGIAPVPTRKHERIDAIAALFADPEARDRVTSQLSAAARSLLARIADAGGPGSVHPADVGLDPYGIHRARPPRYAFELGRSSVPDDVAPLAELAAHGIVGMEAWDQRLWVWREAWSLLDRPVVAHWPHPSPPGTAPLSDTTLRLPAVVGLAERALLHWDEVPPPALKSGEARLAKGVLRSTAKALGTDEATVEVVADAALSAGLLLPNVVRSSGRGRNRTVDQVWLADPEVREAWSQASGPQRWLRIVAEWLNGPAGGGEQLVANRHLLLWALGGLADDQGWTDDTAAARWLEHRYAPVAVEEAVLECLRDLRSLGMVTAEGPVGLTPIARLALEDPASVERADFGSAVQAIVQADETVVCPPDLDADLLVRLGQVATLESDTGARIFRLDERSITKAVQRGDSADSILEFLADLSAAPLPDVVRTLVTDCARRAERVRVVGAATVVVVDDPADLATACALKSTKLQPLTPTVAVSALAPAKVREILDRKGLAPLLIDPSATDLTPRRSSDEAAQLERMAERQRAMAAKHHLGGLAQSAERLAQEAAAARDPASKLSVAGPLAVTPLLLARLRS